jgi:hypothetical protein
VTGLLLLLLACADPGQAPTVPPVCVYPQGDVHLLGTLYLDSQGAQVWRVDDGPTSCYLLWNGRVTPMGCVR